MVRPGTTIGGKDSEIVDRVITNNYIKDVESKDISDDSKVLLLMGDFDTKEEARNALQKYREKRDKINGDKMETYKELNERYHGIPDVLIEQKKGISFSKLEKELKEEGLGMAYIRKTLDELESQELIESCFGKRRELEVENTIIVKAIKTYHPTEKLEELYKTQ